MITQVKVVIYEPGKGLDDYENCLNSALRKLGQSITDIQFVIDPIDNWPIALIVFQRELTIDEKEVVWK